MVVVLLLLLLTLLLLPLLTHLSLPSHFPLSLAGEVCLKKEEEYKEWKIEIKVQFRHSAEKTTLSAAVQSGGERAVSTVLYLMALQDLTPCPFR